MSANLIFVAIFLAASCRLTLNGSHQIGWSKITFIVVIMKSPLLSLFCAKAPISRHNTLKTPQLLSAAKANDANETKPLAMLQGFLPSFVHCAFIASSDGGKSETHDFHL
jgi:hypothetical protein